MTFWEVLLLLVTAPLWAPFAIMIVAGILLGVVALFGFVIGWILAWRDK